MPTQTTAPVYPQVGDRVKCPGSVTAKVWSVDLENRRAVIGMGKSHEFGSYQIVCFKWSKDYNCWKILKRDW